MKNRFLSSVFSRRAAVRRLVGVGLAISACAGSARAQQSASKTADIDFAVSADGSMNMAFQMSFDAANWQNWKATVGDEPARMRAMLRHQFAAMTLDDFKLERDDVNRVAKMSMHSPSGPELHSDGSFQIPVDGYFRLISHAGREWFFSGNNPNAGGTLNNVKVTLPANVTGASVTNPDSPDQALMYTLAASPSASRWFYLAGGLVSLLGLALVFIGRFARRHQPAMLPAGQTRVLPVGGYASPAAAPPAFTSRATAPVVPPPFRPEPASGPISAAPAEEINTPQRPFNSNIYPGEPD